MRKSFASLALMSGVLASLLFFAESASAIPSWARRYGTSCTTCHVVPPKLNAFGIAFKNNGYMIPVDDAKFIKQPDVEMGSPGWKKVWPKGGVWPSSISDRVPLSVIVEMFMTVTPKEPVKVDFAFPTEFGIIAGGTLGPAVSYFGEIAFEFANGETETDFERGHISFRPFETRLFNLRLGRFETAATPFSRFSHKLTDEDFIVSDFRAVPGGFRFRNRQQGFEVWGARNGPHGGGFQYGLGLVNGSGSSNDNNSQKDVYASASYKFGGYGVTGPVKSLDTLKPTQNFKDNSVEVGGFVYLGRTGENPLEEVRYNRAGLKVNAYLDRLNLFGAYVHGSDRVLASGLPNLNTNAWFVEGDVVTVPWIVGILRYDQAVGPAGFLHVKRVVPGAAIMIRSNVIATAEVPIYLGEKNALVNGDVRHNAAAFGLKFVF